jgi:type I restriction enzyme S subunit
MKLRLRTLSELAEVHSGSGAPQDPNAFTPTGHPFVRAGSLPKLLDGADEGDLERLEPATAEQYGLSLFPAGTVLFAKSGMSATKGYVYCLRNPAYVVSHLAALVPRTASDSAFLVQALRRFPPTALIKDPAYPSIRLGEIENMKVPVPSDPSDRRLITEILDKADAVRAKRRGALAQLDALTQGIFLDMFGDPATNPKGWITSSLKKCTNRVQIGPFGSLLHRDDYVSGGIPIVNPTHIRAGVIVPDPSQSVTASKKAELSLYRLCQGDVVMGRRGEMGRCAVVGADEDGFICGTGSLFIRPDTKEATAPYLDAVLSSATTCRWLERASLGATLPNLNRAIIEELVIPVPPMAAQDMFAREISVIERLRDTQRVSLLTIDALFASLQDRAFHGEL